MKTLILILALISFGVDAGLIKSEWVTPSQRRVVDCSAKVYRAQFMVETNQITKAQGYRMARGCKAMLKRYDAEDLAMRQRLVESIRALIK